MEISKFEFLDWYKSLYAYTLGKLDITNLKLMKVHIGEYKDGNIQLILSFLKGSEEVKAIFCLCGGDYRLLNFDLPSQGITKDDFYLVNVDFGSILSNVFYACSKRGIVAHSIEFEGNNKVDLLRITHQDTEYRVLLSTSDSVVSGESDVRVVLDVV